ncbi:hypothetical protein TPHA_0J02150 [Tetrapisispora phaffii CBS 4417]|uniref:Uncharacterized protein n=1 Tax=Tetrapisispora phaffii (strain ATCC 24235 / CBS 4417 / NBRC 1672 / NRRL Y-8282 / UCD 70-5) TaxID=1071381 RepID=G8BYU3_TETPH|nr:hypothetical protein TPHA_0J02150 [Tetrapisispora phaffii CBS 4417]CCE65035.1 hypothetical protein TPHA_0J02150 [Tetrapisispora phaffii CBS 4417]
MSKHRGRKSNPTEDATFSSPATAEGTLGTSAAFTKSLETFSPEGVTEKATDFLATDAVGQKGPNSSSSSHVHIKQFSGRPRDKSISSVKNLSKGFSHDIQHEVDNVGSKYGSFKKSKSTDLLFRRRNISGLNMTSYTNPKPNDLTETIDGVINNTSGSNNNDNYTATNNTGNPSYGLKPRRSKSTHSVLELHEADELYTNDLTTDEEVEYFTEEDEDQGSQKSKTNISNNLLSQQTTAHSDRFPNHDAKKMHPVHSKLLKTNQIKNKILSDTHLSQLNHAAKITDQLSYKPPSDMIKPSHSKSKVLNTTTSNSEGNKLNEDDIYSSNKTNNDDTDIINDNEEDDEEDDEEDEEDEDAIGDDLIGDIPIEQVMQDTVVHSLKRQANMFSELKNNNNISKNPDSSVDNTKGGEKQSFNENYIQPGAGHTDQYIPDMILSQSMGIERKYDDSTRSARSLSSNHEITKITEGEVLNTPSKLNDPSNTIDENQLYPGYYGNTADLTEPRKPKDIKTNIPITDDNNNNFQSFSNSISSLTNNLQKSNPEGFFSQNKTVSSPTSKQKHFLSNTISSLKPSSGRGLNSIKSSHNNDNINESSLNNFANFLKSDDIDGDSRTQKKLLLQRENSILDINLQHEDNNAIFMAGNIDAKREFERVSHAYTNLRRFSNPLFDALIRWELSFDNSSQISNLSTTNDLNELLFSSYSSKDDGKLNKILPSSDYTNLHRTLANLWNQESNKFNSENNPLSKVNKLTTTGNNILKGQPPQQQNPQSLRGVMGSSTALHNLRNINSLQPTTRAVNRRLENSRNISHR